ncbi:hypothetical protein AVEN_43625-1, partial [Araneus ventricosus]
PGIPAAKNLVARSLLGECFALVDESPISGNENEDQQLKKKSPFS